MTEMEREPLSEDLKAITDALSEVMIGRKLTLETMLTGMHASSWLCMRPVMLTLPKSPKSCPEWPTTTAP